jgi:hypothetical protein
MNIFPVSSKILFTFLDVLSREGELPEIFISHILTLQLKELSLGCKPTWNIYLEKN